MVQNAGLGVGALLRQRREELGQDVDTVARQLRIRPIYIVAIEDGRLQDLPGTAYAVGFVRTYADFLGFDGNRVVASYRDELAQRGRSEPVTWRMEDRESHFPGGKLLLACVLLAGAAYGAWYYLNNTPTGAGLIEAVPEYLKKGSGTASKTEENGKPAEPPSAKSTTEGGSETAAVPATTGESSAPAPQSTPANGAGAMATDGAAPAMTQAGPAAGQEAGQAPVTQAPAGETQAATTTPAPASSNTGSTATQPAGTTSSTMVPTTNTATQTAPATQPGAATLTPPAPAATASAQAEGSEAAPEVAAAAAATTTRISIRAKLESWVQIMDKDGKPILSKVLRAGETYAVPDEKGLIMSTGNAGGIEMVLDGKPLQSLGSVGLVRRNIALDPEKLASGAAFLKTPSPVPPPNAGGANTGD